MYCITCEQFVNIVGKAFHISNIIQVYLVGGGSVSKQEKCYGPFESCKHPKAPENWENFVQEPPEEQGMVEDVMYEGTLT